MRRLVHAVIASGLLLGAAAQPAAATQPGEPGLIAFSRHSGEEFDEGPSRIMTVSPDGTEFDTIIEDGGQPAFSANGRHVAFIRVRREMTWPGDLWVARADGTGQRLLYRPETSVSSPSWSPDGRQIAFSLYTGIAIIHGDGTGFRVLVDDFGDCTGGHYPEWSPHGDRIAFTTSCNIDDESTRTDEIWTVRPDGSDPQRLLDVTALGLDHPAHLTWSPDGHRIAFHAFLPGEFPDGRPWRGIWVMDADGNNAQRLVTGTDRDVSPAWSPDGHHLAFTRGLADGRGTHLYRIRPDGTDLTRLSHPPSPVAHYDPDWQPVPVLADAACPADDVPPAGFEDVAGTHAAAVDCAVWHGLAHGRSETTYASLAPVRRDQMASFLARLLERAGVELPAPSSQGFTDTAGNAHADAIDQLAELGVVRGTTATTYSPAVALTRGQMATLLVEAYELAAGADLPRVFDEFADDDGTTHEDAIDRAAHAGFASGTAVSRYAPGGTVRRDQMASFLSRVADRLVQDGRMRLPE